jgi:hypothetical protein
MKWTLWALLTFLMAGCALSSQAQVPVNAQSFGMDMTAAVVQRADPWPSVSFGTSRLFEVSTSWADIHTAPGTFNFTPLDTWIILGRMHGSPQFIYTFGLTPSWASTSPSDTTCAYLPYGKGGACDPPKDLATNGTGTDANFKTFVTTLMTHLKAMGNPINYFELWNTPQDNTQWKGTPQQLVRMAQDARTIIKQFNANAKILTPPIGAYLVPTSNPCYAAGKLDSLFLSVTANGVTGASQADIVSFHGYFGNPPTPENIVPMINCFKTTAAKYTNLKTSPLWNTEGGWGANTLLSNQANEAAFLARSLLVQFSNNVQRYGWYAWDNPNWGTLWNGSVQTPGNAYKQVYSWLINSTMTRPCAASSNTWTCPLTKTSPTGYQAMAVWNSAGSVSYTVPTGFKQYRTLSGSVVGVTAGSKITIGTSPFLLEN